MLSHDDRQEYIIGTPSQEEQERLVKRLHEMSHYQSYDFSFKVASPSAHPSEIVKDCAVR